MGPEARPHLVAIDPNHGNCDNARDVRSGARTQLRGDFWDGLPRDTLQRPLSCLVHDTRNAFVYHLTRNTLCQFFGDLPADEYPPSRMWASTTSWIDPLFQQKRRGFLPADFSSQDARGCGKSLGYFLSKPVNVGFKRVDL